MFVLHNRSTELETAFAVSKAGKEGIVLKPEQLQAVRHIYKGRDVFFGLQQHLANPFVIKCYCFSLTASWGSLKAAL